ncbi:type IX secretion system plug protein domain-containing protein, partial [Klebsiella pneumoniae]|uniref:type IX secretion system plug protein domain-containing protein n=1 Tax=Klebsiella pneumoniae TaxID=573 RepID=UPI00132F5658
NTALLNFDTPQSGLAYVQQNDLDGQFAVENAETGRGATEADYWQVVFSLKMPEQPQPVYVVGGFNFFHLT